MVRPVPKIDFVRANRRRRRTRRSKIRVCTAGITLFEFSRLNVELVPYLEMMLSWFHSWWRAIFGKELVWSVTIWHFRSWICDLGSESSKQLRSFSVLEVLGTFEILGSFPKFSLNFEYLDAFPLFFGHSISWQSNSEILENLKKSHCILEIFSNLVFFINCWINRRCPPEILSHIRNF